MLYEGCSLILVIDSFSPKPASVPEENYFVVINRLFTILKPPNNFKMIQLIIARGEMKVRCVYMYSIANVIAFSILVIEMTYCKTTQCHYCTLF